MGRLQSIERTNIRHAWNQLFKTSGFYRTLFFYTKFQKLIISLVSRCIQTSDLARTIGYPDILAYSILLEKYAQKILRINLSIFRIYIIDLGHVTAGTWSYSGMRSGSRPPSILDTFVTSWRILSQVDKLSQVDTFWYRMERSSGIDTFLFCHWMAPYAYQK